MESGLDRVRLTVGQRPWATSWPGLVGIAALSTAAALVTREAWVAFAIVGPALLVTNLVTTRMSLELTLGRLAVHAWRAAWVPLPARLQLPLDGLDLHWTPTRAPMVFGVRTWRLELRHRGGTLVLPNVLCTWDELNRLRTALRRGLTVGMRRGGSGSERDVPEALSEIRS